MGSVGGGEPGAAGAAATTTAAGLVFGKFGGMSRCGESFGVRRGD